MKAIGEVIFAVCKIQVGVVISHHLRFELYNVNISTGVCCCSPAIILCLVHVPI